MNNQEKTKQNYCDLQDNCQIVEQITNQYNQVVKQNQSLQSQLLWQKGEMEKDNQYLIKLEEANMLLEQDIERLNRQVELLKEGITPNQQNKNTIKLHKTSEIICKMLKINYIDFSIPENFIRLLDLLFITHKYFHLHIEFRTKNILEDTLAIIKEETEYEIHKNPRKVEKLADIIHNEFPKPLYEISEGKQC